MLKKAEKKAEKAAATTPARKTTSARKRKAKTVTYEMIEGRAYEIFESGGAGSDVDNWLLAERELQSA